VIVLSQDSGLPKQLSGVGRAKVGESFRTTTKVFFTSPVTPPANSNAAVGSRAVMEHACPVSTARPSRIRK